jgi:hypothetical protein
MVAVPAVTVGCRYTIASTVPVPSANSNPALAGMCTLLAPANRSARCPNERSVRPSYAGSPSTEAFKAAFFTLVTVDPVSPSTGRNATNEASACTEAR